MKEHKCWNCKKPTKYFDVDFCGPMCHKCSWLCFYNGVLKPKGIRARWKVLMVQLGFCKITDKDVKLELING